MAQVGVQEIIEILDFAEAVAIKAVQVAKDGIQPLDVIKIVSDVSLWAKGVAAVKGIKELDDEIKDLDPEEAKQVVARCMLMIKNIAAAAKN